MAFDPSSLLQGVSSIVNLVLWIAKAENAPKEVSRCLELVKLIYKDTQYLIELRDEALSALEQTPRELARINEVIVSSTRSIQDIGGFLEKYRPEAHNGRTSIRSRVVWVVSDSETFSLRAPNLMVQHNTVLGEIQTLRTYQMIGPLLKATRETEMERAEGQTRFEHVSLLQALMGDDSRKSQLQVLSSPSDFAPPHAPVYSRTPTFDIMGQNFDQGVTASRRSTFRPQHQPSLASLFSPPPPYSPPDDDDDDNDTTSGKAGATSTKGSTLASGATTDLPLSCEAVP